MGLIERAVARREEREAAEADGLGAHRRAHADAIRPDEKDRPLLLRRRRDGALYLNSPTFPSRIELQKDWMLATAECELIDPDHFVLLLANAQAVYRVRRDWMFEQVPRVDGVLEERRISTGYWGELIEERYSEATDA